jgi:hypothetical protein
MAIQISSDDTVTNEHLSVNDPVTAVHLSVDNTAFTQQLKSIGADPIQ